MANKKITDFTADTAPTSDDLIPTVNDPGGTPTNKKSTLGNVFQAFKNMFFGTDAGSTDTYAATLDPIPSAYVTGQIYWFKANTANTGAATINFNTLGAKTIVKVQGGITTTLADNDIRAGQWVVMIYDGTNMQMVGQLGNAPASGSTINSTDLFAPYRVNSTTFGNSAMKFVDTGGGTSITQFTNGTNLQDVQGKTFANGAVTGQDYFYLNGTGGGLDLGTNNSIGWGATTGYFAANSSARKGQQIRLDGSAGATFYFPPYSPSQITSNQDDYNGSGQHNLVIRFTTDASRNITGFRVPAGSFGDRQVAGEVHKLINVGSFNAVFKHQDSGSTSSNRFLFSTGRDITVPPDSAIFIYYDGTTGRWRDISTSQGVTSGLPVEIGLAVSDETTAITTGTAKVTFRMPFAMKVTAVRASVNTVSSSGLPTVDINEAGTTILSTKLTIDASEFTSTTAATAAVISDPDLADDAEITIDIDTAGTGAKGLKVWIIGVRV